MTAQIDFGDMPANIFEAMDTLSMLIDKISMGRETPEERAQSMIQEKGLEEAVFWSRNDWTVLCNARDVIPTNNQELAAHRKKAALYFGQTHAKIYKIYQQEVLLA